jgi:hypothetical protein
VSAIRILLAGLLIAASTAARAQLSQPPPPPSPSPDATAVAIPAAIPTATPTPTAISPSTEARSPILGLQVGAGLPDGAVLSLAFRPYTPYVRLNGGLAWNYYGFGLQGGATLLPFHSGITPTLTGEIGTFFASDVSSTFSGTLPGAFKGPLSSLSYQYASGLLGIEMGRPDSFVFFIRAGLSRLWASASGVRGYQTGSTTIDTGPLHMAVTIPTANLGFAFYVW